LNTPRVFQFFFLFPSTCQPLLAYLGHFSFLYVKKEKGLERNRERTDGRHASSVPEVHGQGVIIFFLQAFACMPDGIILHLSDAKGFTDPA
jgi:hypothetical protein